MSNIGRIAEPGSGARLNRKQYHEWYRRYRAHDELVSALKAVQVIAPRIVAAIPEYKHEMDMVSRALSNT